MCVERIRYRPANSDLLQSKVEMQPMTQAHIHTQAHTLYYHIHTNPYILIYNFFSINRSHISRLLLLLLNTHTHTHSSSSSKNLRCDQNDYDKTKAKKEPLSLPRLFVLLFYVSTTILFMLAFVVGAEILFVLLFATPRSCCRPSSNHHSSVHQKTACLRHHVQHTHHPFVAPSQNEII